jgi:hypothetical protein
MVQWKSVQIDSPNRTLALNDFDGTNFARHFQELRCRFEPTQRCPSERRGFTEAAISFWQHGQRLPRKWQRRFYSADESWRLS